MIRLLLLDDDAGNRLALRTLFEEEGDVVEEAHGISEALAMLRGATCGYVVVIDLFLPYMIGWTLLRELERDPVLAQQHAYVATTASRMESSREVADLLARLHIPCVPKPFDLAAIADAVAQASARLTPDCRGSSETTHG
jgi:CheY-like chemotaxis protein